MPARTVGATAVALRYHGFPAVEFLRRWIRGFQHGRRGDDKKITRLTRLPRWQRVIDGAYPFISDSEMAIYPVRLLVSKIRPMPRTNVIDRLVAEGPSTWPGQCRRLVLAWSICHCLPAPNASPRGFRTLFSGGCLTVKRGLAGAKIFRKTFYGKPTAKNLRLISCDPLTPGCNLSELIHLVARLGSGRVNWRVWPLHPLFDGAESGKPKVWCERRHVAGRWTYRAGNQNLR